MSKFDDKNRVTYQYEALKQRFIIIKREDWAVRIKMCEWKTSSKKHWFARLCKEK